MQITQKPKSTGLTIKYVTNHRSGPPPPHSSELETPPSPDFLSLLKTSSSRRCLRAIFFLKWPSGKNPRPSSSTGCPRFDPITRDLLFPFLAPDT